MNEDYEQEQSWAEQTKQETFEIMSNEIIKPLLEKILNQQETINRLTHQMDNTAETITKYREVKDDIRNKIEKSQQTISTPEELETLLKDIERSLRYL